ncbi:metallophosphoesterase family [Trichomonas vaginalis G3]|uniref:metallophosphoesterase family n=1 Tax=Trichomonas vaginalis (strain ATCC PRA-98 / G3) TaxID=412133 RepID=UPI0021E57B43|nr:metallophosphoesterase family [Trichomonas vaginalis G3]KAI5490802.1 metallophosphoesterase family [Trichomonas vaginalis G3]
MSTGKAKVWAISDPHLPSAKDKKMEKYDPVWTDHPKHILENLQKVVGPNDVVLIPGDISWADKITEMEEDLKLLAAIPCKVIISEGNHDRWASKASAIKELPSNVTWTVGKMQRIGNLAIVSQRLWDIEGIFPWPGHIASKGASEKTPAREINRLETQLKLLPQDKDIIRILMVHFPPVAYDGSPGILTDMINKYNVDYCIYGHVHGQKEDPNLKAHDIVIGCTHFYLTSCDWLKMIPKEICEFTP